MPLPAKVIAIIGLSGSGKSTVADEFANIRGDVTVVRQDHFLRERALRPGPSLDDKYDFAKMSQVIQRLSAGERIEILAFNQQTRIREDRLLIQPADYLVVEGISVLRSHSPRIDLSFFIDVPWNICLERQIARLDQKGWYEGQPRDEVVAAIRAKEWTENLLIREQRSRCLPIDGTRSLYEMARLIAFLVDCHRAAPSVVAA